ncbi:Aste57867_24203 [Aphanomyces stellatus]|uniref:Aste57867_24203 protein n=1 Tax=Aphanomyces stellatus TaxID=120398 RepID=A0A485LRE2_9STRA|nr:hypothetical protein As57867_024129 [Aphanomyces stellatus]VFU00845.1 Aste57867_24203 [Aphanomyces stellatus]
MVNYGDIKPDTPQIKDDKDMAPVQALFTPLDSTTQASSASILPNKNVRPSERRIRAMTRPRLLFVRLRQSPFYPRIMTIQRHVRVFWYNVAMIVRLQGCTPQLQFKILVQFDAVHVTGLQGIWEWRRHCEVLTG